MSSRSTAAPDLTKITDPDILRLIETFDGPPTAAPAKWSGLWDDNFLPWDKGFSSPAIVDLLSASTSTFTSDASIASAGAAAAAAIANQKAGRKRALVPGCGKGYDVILLAEHGYEAWGADVSEKAMRLAREEFERLKKERKKEEGMEKKEQGEIRVEFRVGNFFEVEWVRREVLALEEGEGEVEGSFDFVYDYTFLCALHPSMRTDWAKQMSYLLAKNTGLLICLESHIYDELLSDKFELVERYKPERSHKTGKGTDMVSVWRRRG
ncbi:S-adenosyl-L-methionine-dependent methyltransferase [Kalaharituber pfeilii]|nr:S-adenosyl-L-methionine-dependent methyltransferase [Kalaharituber pfeilii]